MLDDLIESVAEVIYLSEMERSDIEGYSTWDELADNVQEPYFQIAEEILDIVGESDAENVDESVDVDFLDWN